MLLNGYFYADLWNKRMGRLSPFVPTFFRKGCVLFHPTFFNDSKLFLYNKCYICT